MINKFTKMDLISNEQEKLNLYSYLIEEEGKMYPNLQIDKKNKTVIRVIDPIAISSKIKNILKQNIWRRLIILQNYFYLTQVEEN